MTGSEIPHSAFRTPHSPMSRRQVLARTGMGFGTLALAGLLDQQGLLSSVDAAELDLTRPLAPRDPQFKATATRRAVPATS